MVRIFATLLFLIAAMAATSVPGAGEQPAKAEGKRGDSSKGEDPSRETAPAALEFWGSALHDKNDPLRIFRDALQIFGEQSAALRNLLREQDLLVEKLRAENRAVRPGRPTVLGLRHLRERGQLLSQLQENQSAVEEIQTSIRKAAQRVVTHSGDIHQRLTDIQENLEKQTTANAPDSVRRMREHQKERVVAAIRLLDVVDADPEHGVEKVIDALQRMVEFRERRGSPIALHQIQSQLEDLEREQVFLRQRLDVNTENLATLRGQLQRLIDLQQPRPAMLRERGDLSTQTLPAPAPSPAEVSPGAKPSAKPTPREKKDKKKDEK